MSLIPLGMSVALATTIGLISQIFTRSRSIGGIVPDVTIEEHHEDRLRITDHPVAQGAAITDHAFKEPSRVTIHVGFSNSSFQALGDPTYATEMYAELLSLQESREPFTIVTGKRVYSSMLIEFLTTTTDERTENVLLIHVHCRQVILVDTQVVSVPDQKVQQAPQNNAATADAGTKSLAPATSFNDRFYFKDVGQAATP